ncbi:MAG: DUF1501 domain-containing protein [Planctomycetota bacterium]|nr:DUF1501 domain-containing protein [Planctomycetota bacterium]
MLNILGARRQFCDGVSRRDFMRIGALGVGATSLTLSDILRAESQDGRGSRHKSVIHIFLGGGPPHQDMFDLKMDAPVEIRGEFKPIATTVSGIQIGETLPQIAGIMDKCVLIRSVVGAVDSHSPYQCNTGWTTDSLRSLGGRPCFGSATAKLLGPTDPSVPPFVGLATPGVWRDPGQPGFLGPTYAPFSPEGPGLEDMRLQGITLDRLNDRKALFSSFNAFQNIVDRRGAAGAYDAFAERAFDVLTSSRLLDALDLSAEDPKVLARYGTGEPFQYTYDGAPTNNRNFLVARRLVEAGARCVSFTYGRWDSHLDNFTLVRDHGSKFDQAFTALIEDLAERNLLNDVTVIAWGEFGRTPRINPQAGRDHWPLVGAALMAGGGMPTGQVIGSTNRLGEVAKDRPVHMQEVVATLYNKLGLDTTSVTLVDPTGRPQYLTEHPPMHELI